MTHVNQTSRNTPRPLPMRERAKHRIATVMRIPAPLPGKDWIA